MHACMHARWLGAACVITGWGRLSGRAFGREAVMMLHWLHVTLSIEDLAGQLLTFFFFDCGGAGVSSCDNGR